VLLFSTQRTSVEAGVTATIQMSIDCDLGTGGIQNTLGACTFPSASSDYEIGVVIENLSASPTSVGSVNFEVVADTEAVFNPNPSTSPPNDGNPDYTGGGGLSCTPPDPIPDSDPDPNVAVSFLSCFTGSANGPTIAGSGSLLIATVSYTTVLGSGNFAIRNAAVSDNSLTEIGSCNDPIDIIMDCFGASVQIGTAVVDTPTPIPSATNTPPAVTNTPCVGASCPTATSVGFRTVTPTPSATVPATAVPPGAPTTAPGAPPPPPAGTGAPGGAPGGTGTIRLPDTGTGGDGGADWTMMLTYGGLAVVAGTLAGGLWFGAAMARAAARREGGE
jgi:hypothetical protein